MAEAESLNIDGFEVAEKSRRTDGAGMGALILAGRGMDFAEITGTRALPRLVRLC